MNEQNKEQEYHFFASSVAEWITSKEGERELPEVLAWMEKAGYPYSLWMVPGAWDSNYEIKWYAPQVKGTIFLGHFTPKKAKAKKAA